MGQSTVYPPNYRGGKASWAFLQCLNSRPYSVMRLVACASFWIIMQHIEHWIVANANLQWIEKPPISLLELCLQGRDDFFAWIFLLWFTVEGESDALLVLSLACKDAFRFGTHVHGAFTQYHLCIQPSSSISHGQSRRWWHFIGEDGIIVEIDESKFGKRKYNRGHRVDGCWVLGGV